MIVTTLQDFGPGSLREIIKEANRTPLPEKAEHGLGLPNPYIYIEFAVSGVITLTQNLPKIKRQNIEIIGNSQIEINCNNNDGLKICADRCSVKNISITNSNSYAIGLFSDNNYIVGCRIGLDFNDVIKPNFTGIFLKDSNFNIIGDNFELQQNYFSNVISGNKFNGITLCNSHNNIIQNNIIGLDSTGENKIPNLKDGINLIESNDNFIGGTVYTDSNQQTNNPTGDKGTINPTFVRPLLGNIISGNGNSGVTILRSERNQLSGNFIGTNKTGTFGIGNKNGISVKNSSYINIIGCKVYENPFVYYNVISGNQENGIEVEDSNFTTIQGNFIGISSMNNISIPNADGVNICGNSSFTTFGGVIPLGNVSSGNHGYGIILSGNTRKFLSFNTFCGIFAFGGMVGNGKGGFLLKDNTSDHDIRTNVISGNAGHGIEITGNANAIRVVCNIVGLDTFGHMPYPNSGDGLNISGRTSDILVINDDVPSVIPRNVFSGNKGSGIVIGGCAKQVEVSGTIVGFDISGINQISNLMAGVVIDKYSSGNKIGKLAQSNYITSDTNPAIIVFSGHNVISFNRINVNLTLDRVPFYGENYSDQSGCSSNAYYSNDTA